MKKIVLVLTVALLGSIVMNAQPPHRQGMSTEQIVEKRIEMLDKALSLTAEQKAEIAKICADELKSMSQERATKVDKGSKPDEEMMKARREKMKAQREATNSKIESVLTPEQAAKFAQIMNHEGRRGHEKGPRGPHSGDRKAPRHDSCCNNCNCKQGE